MEIIDAKGNRYPVDIKLLFEEYLGDIEAYADVEATPQHEWRVDS